MRYFKESDIRAVMLATLKRRRRHRKGLAWTKSSLIAAVQGMYYPGYIDGRFVYIQDCIRAEFQKLVAEGIIFYKPFKPLRMTLDVSRCPQVHENEDLTDLAWIAKNEKAVKWFLKEMTGGSDMVD